MPILAIAGGTSASLGRAITTALLSSPSTHAWRAVILSRTSNVPIWLRAVDPEGSRTQVRAVDYLSPASLNRALQGVHTIVSVTSAIDGSQAQIQINLLNAAVTAGCKRFAPSQWGFGVNGWENVASMKWTSEGVWEECVKQRSRIECARFNQGSFMNYVGLGMFPVPSTVDQDTALQRMREGGGYAVGEDGACQGLLRQGDLEDGSGAFLIGLKNGIAELPVKDDGSWPRITMTSIRDVGRFFVAALELPKWKEDMSMAGDTVTMGELLAHAEDITGKKFQVRVVNRAELEKKLEELLQEDFMGRLWTEFKLAYIRDLEDEVVLRPVINLLCPDINPMGVRQYMETYWGA
ncbi:hypothetical protein EKO04_010867 [Ascochyta lentis]|uniref:NmrA-like domain-containing protein n=1 Tax=Ascochyta lentis TaxID=205686 RepID=A0A8H7MDU2_9PLEO|nr:hypothetical protein EKO04_010867 [Ascochyta lentis]